MKDKVERILENKNLLKIIFLVSAIMFALPSIYHMLKNGTVLQFDQYFKFCLSNNGSRFEQAIIYIIILALLTIFYFLIVKNREKIFKNTKEMYIYVTIISLIFVLVIPFMCSDVFYYLGVGRIDGKYGQNPYYVTIKDFVENGDNAKYLETDTVLLQGYENDWAATTVVYGPIWTLVCKVVATMSFGNIDIGLLAFKLIAVLLHVLNCYILYKITNKKIFILLYGLNPFVLIEGIVSVHNDLYIVTFILSSIYFLIKKKNLFISLLFLALATAIKYFTILLLPFIIIYYFRDKKPLEKLKKCFTYGFIFAIMLAITYIAYVQDWTVLMGLITQQERYAKNFYIILMEYFQTVPDIVSKVHNTFLIGFVIVYFFTCVTLLFKKDIKFRQQMRTAEYFLIAFLFLLITNFQPWYLMWLFPLVIYQNSKESRFVIQIMLISQFANSIFLINGEGWKNGVPFTFFMLLGVLICVLIGNKNRMCERKE